MVRALFNRNIWRFLNKPASSVSTAQAVRASHAVNYRTAPPVHRVSKIGAEVVGAAMWWWVFWHLWHESEHITGEFPYPEPSEWTNKELGIPTDEA